MSTARNSPGDDAGGEEPRGLVERMMFMRVPAWAVLLSWLLALLGLILFGALVRYELQGGGRLSFAARPALEVASIPATLRGAATAEDPALADEQEPALADGFSRPADSSFVDPGFALISRYAPDRERFVVRLIRLSDGQVLREYAPDVEAINRQSKLDTGVIDLDSEATLQRYVLMHPYLTPDGGIVFKNMTPFTHVDACGRLDWKVDGLFHHSTERDAEGRFWMPWVRQRSDRPNVTANFMDDGIAQVSPRGRLLFTRSMTDIFAANGLSHLYEGRPYHFDPFHLNDIEPVLATGPHWRKGDLFLSFRHLSLVLLYRPSTNRVIWYREGSWQGQHDVNILDDHRISIFDNRSVAGGGDRDWVRDVNRILVYDFAIDEISEPMAAALERNRVRTVRQGRATPLPNGDWFVEETMNGRLLRLAPDGTVRWQYVVADADKRRYVLGWSRYLDPATMGSAVRAAEAAQCE